MGYPAWIDRFYSANRVGVDIEFNHAAKRDLLLRHGERELFNPEIVEIANIR